ncbi:MAG: S24/S26 family peptidase [Pseudomonadota bacterium]
MRIVRVIGHSMSPRYRHGDYLLVGRYRVKTPRVGDDVVFEHDDLGSLCKRIARIEHGRVHVRGLNALSTEPKSLSALSPEAADRLERVIGSICRRSPKRTG